MNFKVGDIVQMSKYLKETDLRQNTPYKIINILHGKLYDLSKSSKYLYYESEIQYHRIRITKMSKKIFSNYIERDGFLVSK